jgi:hypothetical protein
MQDNFNLTGWVRNKRLLKEEEQPDFTKTFEVGKVYTNSIDGKLPVGGYKEWEVVDKDPANNELTVKDIKSGEEKVVDAFQFSQKFRAKEFESGDSGIQFEEVDESNDLYSTFPSFDNDTDNNEDQSAWERFYEEGYLAGYKACQNRQPNRFAKGEQPVSDYQAMRNSEKY